MRLGRAFRRNRKGALEKCDLAGVIRIMLHNSMYEAIDAELVARNHFIQPIFREFPDCLAKQLLHVVNSGQRSLPGGLGLIAHQWPVRGAGESLVYSALKRR